jgi:hypothetical protein
MTSPPQPHIRRLKILTLTWDGTEVSGQVNSWKFDPGIKLGNQLWTFSTAGEGHNMAFEETDPQATLDAKFYDDWRNGGISDFLWTTAPFTVVPFQLDHHPDITTEHVVVAGSLVVLPHPIGGDARANEQGEQTFGVLAGYTYTRGS